MKFITFLYLIIYLIFVMISLIDLLMWSQATESLTNTAVTLGADVIITCDLDIEEIYWYSQKSPDPPVFILHTCNSTQYNKFQYSVNTNGSMFIRNISTDELGVYYCVKTSEPQKFSNATKIYISGEFWISILYILFIVLSKTEIK